MCSIDRSYMAALSEVVVEDEDTRLLGDKL